MNERVGMKTAHATTMVVHVFAIVGNKKWHKVCMQLQMINWLILYQTMLLNND